MADGETKSANGSGARSEIVRKPSRRSPTTGHRRKKTDLKRSQSSPREEAIVPTSSDDERNAPVRRKSLSPGLGPEPKKVLRRRHRVKEKNEGTKDVTKETKNEDTAVSSILKKQASNAQSPATKMEDEPKSVNASMSEPKSRTTNTPAAPKDDDEEIFRTTKIDGAPKAERQKSIDSKPKQKNGELRDAESAVENDEAKSKTENENEKQNDCKEDKATRPISWWGGWSPFSRETEPAEATGFDSRGEDYVTSDDETAMEFVKLLSGNRNNKKVEVRKSISSLDDAKSLLDDAKSSLDDAKSSLTDETRPLLGQNGEGVKSWSQIVRESRAEFAKYKKEFPQETATLKKLRNRCICELLIMFIFCGCGAFVFKTTEGTFESFYKCGVKRVKRDFIDDLWRSSHFMKEEDWKSKARSKLWQFENQLQEAFEAGVNTYSGQKSWSFINGVIYCLTVVTTIGYGHIAPVTNSGRALTIAYSIIGIPLFLILLADFGKLFTRGIKFLWAFVRRVYYTGSCKKVRRTGPVQEVMKGVQMMYETIRRPSMFPQGPDGECPGQENLGTPGDPPSTPALSVFAIDDEFNLPISVAITILLVYIFMGATVFWCWEEDWTFFESFYFVFISMSTIGFGDLVPKNQMYMMLSIVYLAFGLALTSMCINVVQEKLSDSFRKASAKIGATIGLKVSDDDGTISPVSPTHVEIAEVHKSLRAPAIQLMANPQHEVS